MAQVKIFVSDEGGVERVALLLQDPGIVEHEGELTPGLALTPAEARRLAACLFRTAQEIETYEPA